MSSIIDSISKLENISTEKRDRLIKMVSIVHVKKGTVLQETGNLNAKAYFVKSGLLRSYTIDEKGKEHIYIFAPEGWVIGDMKLPGDNEPTGLYVDAIEDSEIEVVQNLNKNEFYELLPLSHSQNELERLMKRVSVLQKRVIMLMSATAMERYNEFIKTYPQIIQRAPQKMIASYLGITPEALSKIKGQKLRNK